MSIKVTAKKYGTAAPSLVLEIPPYVYDKIINIINLYGPIEITSHAKAVIERERSIKQELDRRHNRTIKQNISRLGTVNYEFN